MSKLANGKHPKLKLSGQDGNVFFIIGRATRALREAGATDEEIRAFQTEVTTTTNYNSTIAAIMKWCRVS